ncbi:MAG: hypothetical protein AAF191_12215, partial [Verrucomicrobiota bacterium]
MRSKANTFVARSGQLLRVFGRAWRPRRASIASEQLAWAPPVSRDVCPYLPLAMRCAEKPRDWVVGPLRDGRTHGRETEGSPLREKRRKPHASLYP